MATNTEVSAVPLARPTDIQWVTSDEAPTSEEPQWYLDHRRELIRQFGGEWIAVTTDGVVANGIDLAVVLDAARKCGHDRPFVVQVPRQAGSRLTL